MWQSEAPAGEAEQRGWGRTRCTSLSWLSPKEVAGRCQGQAVHVVQSCVEVRVNGMGQEDGRVEVRVNGVGAEDGCMEVRVDGVGQEAGCVEVRVDGVGQEDGCVGRACVLLTEHLQVHTLFVW